jgi:hypothetical protein
MKPRFQPPRKEELSYFQSIWKAVSRYFKHEDISARVLTVPEWLEAYAKQAAERMVTGLLSLNARSWREAARESGQGALLHRALSRELSGPSGERVRALVAENANLIKSLPLKIARQVTAEAARAQSSGGRAASFASSVPSASRARAILIARTEVSKASTALTEARAESLDLPWYVWRTSEDERVRPSHRKMANVLIRWDNPPAPERLTGEKSTLGHYNAGNCPNDRCYAEPLITLGQVKWPHRVYLGNSIQYLTRSQFERLDLRRAA